MHSPGINVDARIHDVACIDVSENAKLMLLMRRRLWPLSPAWPLRALSDGDFRHPPPAWPRRALSDSDLRTFPPGVAADSLKYNLCHRCSGLGMPWTSLMPPVGAQFLLSVQRWPWNFSCLHWASYYFTTHQAGRHLCSTFIAELCDKRGNPSACEPSHRHKPSVSVCEARSASTRLLTCGFVPQWFRLVHL